MSGLQKEKEKKESGSGLLSTLLLAGGAAAIGYLAHKLQSNYEEQAQGAAAPTSWDEGANSTRRKQNRDKVSDNDLPDCVKCIVCMENGREIILVPCGHVCLCEDCSMKLVDDKCPVCKHRIEDKKIAYLP